MRSWSSSEFGGIDELGDSVIAIAILIAFTVALIEDSHIRINQLTLLMLKRQHGHTKPYESRISYPINAVYFILRSTDLG